MGMGAEIQVLVRPSPPPVVLWVVMVLWSMALALVSGTAPPPSVVLWSVGLALGLGPGSWP